MAHPFWQEQRTEFSTVATLTVWRWRQQWLLLLITGLGVLAATTLVCSLPLFSSVMVTAGLRTTLRASPANANIEVRMGLSGLSSAAIDEATRQVSSRFTQDLASYVNTTGDLSTQIEVPNWLIAGTINQVNLHGVSMREAAPHLQVLQGRLPSDDGTTLDVALTRSAATYMQVHVGSRISLSGLAKTLPATDNEVPQIYAQTLTLQVVGIFQTLPDDAYWHSQTFQEPAPLPHANPVPFTVLISSAPFLHWVDTLTQRYQTRGIVFAVSSTCFLTYKLVPEHLSAAQLDDLTNRLQQLQADVARMQVTNSANPHFDETIFPYIAGVSIDGATLHSSSGPELLDAFQNEVLLGRATMLILTIQIACLILFFVSTLAQAQVERQMPALALLRSRGASGLQILATLLIQSFILCLLAGCLAPLLALEVVRLSAPLFLPTNAQDALNALPSTYAALLGNIGFYALAALLIVLGTQLLAFITALRGNILTLRREAGRSSLRPLWLRLRLDLVLAMVALASYGFSFYIQGTAQLLDARSQLLLLTPLSLLAPLLLLLACVLFFLRLFPTFLRLLLRLVAGRRSAASLLAVAQIARAPRQPVRLTLLLGLALAFAIFTLVFAASQGQRVQDLAAYQAGADFSGYLPANLQTSSLAAQAQITARYRAIAGVISVSSGYAGQADIQVNAGSPNEFFRPLQLRAVDPQTFAQTAVWTPQTSTQSLHSLLAQLAALRPQALRQNVVPAILSASAWHILNIHPGAVFHIFTTGGTRDPIAYLAVTSVAHVPPANESIESGMLVDFQALQAAYQQQKEALPDNYIWLHTNPNPNPSALTQVRHALSTGPLSLSNLADRQALIQVNAANPLALNLLAALSTGVSAALLLALLANLLLPILNLRARLTSFAFLRALGAAPAQILHLLIWEQGLVLVTALLLGTLVGFPLALIAVPALVVDSIPAGSTQAGGANAVYLIQGLIPTRIVLPPSLLLALVIQLALCVLALLLVSRMALRLTLSQQIRLNED